MPVSRQRVPARATICFLLCWIFPWSGGAAQQLPIDLTLNAYVLNKEPIVRSYAKAVLYDDQGDRIYNVQVILGHQVDTKPRVSRFMWPVLSLRLGLPTTRHTN